MEDLITNLISSIIGGADNIINSVFNNLIDTCFNMENHLTTLFGTQWLDFSGLKTVILSFSISLIILLITTFAILLIYYFHIQYKVLLLTMLVSTLY